MKKIIFSSYLKLKSAPLAFMFALLFVAASCDTQDDVQPDSRALVSDNITAALKNNNWSAPGNSSAKERKPTFNTLLVALAKTGLTSTVAKEELTLFAPSDEAFAALGLYPNNIGNVPNLEQILLYHAVQGELYASDLSAGFVPTLNGAAVEVTLNGGVQVNGADVILADKRALNGVIHVIDEVLMPPTLNLVELALSFNPEFTILVAAVQKANLVNTLANDGPFTVFAPTNDAFVALLNELGFPNLDAVPDETLRDILLYHVVPGRIYSSDLSTGDVTAANEDTFYVNTSNLTITDANGREANLVPSLLNVQATNGVVHVIDRVILPELGN
ncbi:fasciclin domain-containing protein [Pontibacter populi]|uniref:Fasciclin domain-containing protein n=1 Tax=Pontibacter populi TaxID=890055 RepID=A0ABV1RQJ2_9BACT